VLASCKCLQLNLMLQTTKKVPLELSNVTSLSKTNIPTYFTGISVKKKKVFHHGNLDDGGDGGGVGGSGSWL
jgi:hypothetical protein